VNPWPLVCALVAFVIAYGIYWAVVVFVVR